MIEEKIKRSGADNEHNATRRNSCMAKTQTAPVRTSTTACSKYMFSDIGKN
jgi:hypothetical protein